MALVDAMIQRTLKMGVVNHVLAHSMQLCYAQQIIFLVVKIPTSSKMKSVNNAQVDLKVL